MVIDSIRKYDWKGRRVLIIEDDPSSVFLLHEILQHTGIGILSVMEGRDAVDAFRKNKSHAPVFFGLRRPEP